MISAPSSRTTPSNADPPQVESLGHDEQIGGEAAHHSTARQDDQVDGGVVEDDRLGTVEVAVLQQQWAAHRRRLKIKSSANPRAAQPHPLAVHRPLRLNQQLPQHRRPHGTRWPPLVHRLVIHAAVARQVQTHPRHSMVKQRLLWRLHRVVRPPLVLPLDGRRCARPLVAAALRHRAPALPPDPMP